MQAAVGYVEFLTPFVPGFEAPLCGHKAGGEVTFYAVGEEMQFDMTLDCLSESGEITGQGHNDFRYQRR